MRIEVESRTLVVHELAGGSGVPLLLLHSLRGSSARWSEADSQAAIDRWRGPVFALDFSGHGESDWRVGGYYSPEHLVADADMALARIGKAVLVGEGLGAYVGLLLAGARVDDVPAVLLFPGDGEIGGGAEPDFALAVDPWDAVPPGDTQPRPQGSVAPDPMLSFLEHDLRPPDYAEHFAETSRRLLLAEHPDPPAWWQLAAKTGKAQAVSADFATALATLSEVVDGDCA